MISVSVLQKLKLHLTSPHPQPPVKALSRYENDEFESIRNINLHQLSVYTQIAQQEIVNRLSILVN